VFSYYRIVKVNRNKNTFTLSCEEMENQEHELHFSKKYKNTGGISKNHADYGQFTHWK
jgi:hypothetical protein